MGGLLISFRAMARLSLHRGTFGDVWADKEEKIPAGTSVGRTKERAEGVFNLPVLLPCLPPIVALRAQESHWDI